MSGPTLELKSEIVRAGAGAGKTTKLTNTVLEVAQRSLTDLGRPPRIVVTTFTRKATEELRERLVRKACELGQPELIDFVTSRSSLHISTIHGVLSLFLRRYGHWLDIDSGFSILEQGAADRLMRKSLRDILVTDPRFEILLEDFTVDQLVKMTHEFSSSGEEAVLEPFSKNQLLEILNTKMKSDGENLLTLSQRLLVVIDSQQTKWLDFVGHLKSCALFLQSSPTPSGKAFSEKLAAIDKPKFMTKTPAFDEGLHDDLKSLLKNLAEYESEEFQPENIQIYAEKSEIFFELATQFSAALLERKLNSGQIEMSDLEEWALRAVREHPEMAQAFSSEWDYWLVDEYQDTSPTQVELLRSLIGEKAIFVVGDPQQSIYLFRGARSEVFTDEEKSIQSRGGDLSQLITNYRSRPELLLFFNDFFKQFNQAFLEMKPRSEIANSKQIVAQFLIVAKDSENPYQAFVAEVIPKIKSGAKFDDICVLARTHRQLQKVAQYFESLDIPTHVHSTDGFFSRREILDALSILKFLLNPLDNLNLIRLIRSPWLKISDLSIATALAHNPSFYWPHFKKELNGHPTITKLQELLEIVDERGILETLRLSVMELGLIDASHIHDATGRRESNIWKLISLLHQKEKTPGFSYLSFIHRVFQGSASAEGNEESDAVAALEPNRVNLMTIHGAKGLKFKHVLVPDLDKRLRTSDSRAHEKPLVVDENSKQFTLALRLGEERKLTHNLAGQKVFEEMSRREEDESLRLLYVALTRAEESVSLHWQEPIEKNSWAEKLRMDFSEGIHQKEYYAYEVKRNSELPESLTKTTAEEQAIRSPWCDLGLETANTIRRISVTKLLEELHTTSDQPKEKKYSPKDLKRHLEIPVLGQKLHTLLERLKFDSEIDTTAYSRKWFADRAPDFERAVKYTLSLKSPPIRELIQNGEVEWGFQMQTARGVVEGQMDLWGTVEGTTWIIDYKSGSSKFREKAFDQLQLYALALVEKGIATPIQLAVIYAVEGQIEIRAAQTAGEIRQRFGL